MSEKIYADRKYVESTLMELVKQPDYSQNDSAAYNYIKNRTHYKQIETKQVVAFKYEPEEMYGAYYQDGVQISYEPILGEMYDVWISLICPTCSCELKKYSDTMWYLGNLTVFPYNWYDGEDTGENFLIIFIVRDGKIVTGSGVGIVTSQYTPDLKYVNPNFTVTGPVTVYYTLDPKYLPDEINDLMSKSYIQSINGNTPSSDGSIWMAPYRTIVEADVIAGLYTCTDSGRTYVYTSQNDPIYETAVIEIDPVELVVGETYTIAANVVQADGVNRSILSHPQELKVSVDGSLYTGNPTIAGLPDDVGDNADFQIGIVFYHTDNVVTSFKYCSTSNLYNSGTNNLTITGSRIKSEQLDEKLVPDTIARVEDIPEINYPVTSVNGQTGDVVIEAGGVTSWNDLEDKPFGEEVGSDREALIDNETLTVVPQTTAHEPCVGICDPRPRISLTVGDKYTVIVNGVEQSFTAMQTMLDGDDCIYVGDLSIWLENNAYSDANVCIAYYPEYDVTHLIVPNLMGDGTKDKRSIVVSVYKDSTIIKTLDEKYIPDTIARKSDLTNMGGVISWNDLEDRPFGEENSGATIEWDGNIEGRDSYDSYGNGSWVAYKVSDLTPSYEELVGGSYSYIIASPEGQTENVVEITEDSIMVIGATPGRMEINEQIYIMDLTEQDLERFGIPSNGIYMLCKEYSGVGSNFSHVNRLTYGSPIIHTIDEKFIPDTIARTSDIPEINYPVTSVNGMTGDVEIVIPEQKDITVNGVAPDENGNIEVEVGGGVSSWNDLTDKPFYEEGSGATIEWDGNTEGRDSFMLSGAVPFYKISDLVPSSSEVVGGVVKTTLTEFTITEDLITQIDGGYFIEESAVVISSTTLTVGETVHEVPSPGIYSGLNEGFYVSSITYGSTTIKTLDEKFIPDTIARVEDITAPKTELILTSSTSGSTKQFKITIDDEGVLTATEIVESAT